MKKFIALLLLVSIRATAQTPTILNDPCNGELKEESTLAQACNFHKEFRVLDQQLDNIYKEKLGQILHPTYLRKAQQSWLQFREDSCNLEQQEFDGLNSVSYLRCRQQITLERIRYLKKF